MTDQSPAYHYSVIARALKIIDAGGPGLTLDDLAGQMGMSPCLPNATPRWTPRMRWDCQAAGGCTTFS